MKIPRKGWWRNATFDFLKHHPIFDFRGADFVPTKIGPDGLYFPYCPFGPSKAVQNMPYKIKK